MPRVEEFTPKAVFDLYQALSEQQKEAFLRLLAGVSTGKVPMFIVSNLSKLAQVEFNRRMYTTFFELMMPVVVERAWSLLSEQPNIGQQEFHAEVSARIQRFLTAMVEETAEQERAKLKEKRDRKSSAETIHRNVEICDLRKQDRKHWSLTRLSKKYKVSVRAITLVIQEETKWRKLASELGSN